MKAIDLRVPRGEFDKIGFDELLGAVGGERIEIYLMWWDERRANAVLEAQRRLDDALSEMSVVEHYEPLQQSESQYYVELAFEDFQMVMVGEFFVDGPMILTEQFVDFTFVTTPKTYDVIEGRIEEDDSLIELDCTVTSVTEYTGVNDFLGQLTDRQREILCTAFEEGYYEIPRQMTTDELADAFGLKRSTVLEHLRRAERNVIASVLN